MNEDIKRSPLAEQVALEACCELSFRLLANEVFEKNRYEIWGIERTTTLLTPFLPLTSEEYGDCYPYSAISFRRWTREASSYSSDEEIQEARRSLVAGLAFEDMVNVEREVTWRARELLALLGKLDLLGDITIGLVNSDWFPSRGRPDDALGIWFIHRIRYTVYSGNESVIISSSPASPFFCLCKILFQLAGVELSDEGLRSKIDKARAE